MHNVYECPSCNGSQTDVAGVKCAQCSGNGYIIAHGDRLPFSTSTNHAATSRRPDSDRVAQLRTQEAVLSRLLKETRAAIVSLERGING